MRKILIIFFTFLSTNCFAEIFEFKKCFQTYTNISISILEKNESIPGHKNWEDYTTQFPSMIDRIFSINTDSDQITFTIKRDLEKVKEENDKLKKDKISSEFWKGRLVFSPIEQKTFKITNFAADLVTGYRIDKDTNRETKIFIDVDKGTVTQKIKSSTMNVESNMTCEILPNS